MTESRITLALRGRRHGVRSAGRPLQQLEQVHVVLARGPAHPELAGAVDRGVGVVRSTGDLGGLARRGRGGQLGVEQAAVPANPQQPQSTGTVTSAAIRAATAVAAALEPSWVEEQVWCRATDPSGRRHGEAGQQPVVRRTRRRRRTAARTHGPEGSSASRRIVSRPSVHEEASQTTGSRPESLACHRAGSTRRVIRSYPAAETLGLPGRPAAQVGDLPRRADGTRPPARTGRGTRSRPRRRSGPARTSCRCRPGSRPRRGQPPGSVAAPRPRGAGARRTAGSCRPRAHAGPAGSPGDRRRGQRAGDGEGGAGAAGDCPPATSSPVPQRLLHRPDPLGAQSPDQGAGVDVDRARAPGTCRRRRRCRPLRSA